MTRRPPRTLWRHLGADLARLVALTALVLVVVISFALSIKFLADGKIDLGGAMIVMGLAALPMLQYALPFAGGFAATLTYHRFTSEHESGAAMAGGVSHNAILFPAFGIGLILLSANLFLAHQAIPHMLRKMERQVRSDLTGVLQRTIERGDSVTFSGFQIHADGMIPLGPDPESGAVSRFQLQGVLALQTQGEGVLSDYISARFVNAWMFEEVTDGAPATTVVLEFHEASGIWDGDPIESGKTRIRIPIQDTFIDEPKYNTFAELRALRTNPENMRHIETLRRRLALALAQQELIEAIRTRLRLDGRATFTRAGGERWVLSARDLVRDQRGWKLIRRPSDERVMISRSASGLPPFSQSADDAWIVLDDDSEALRSPIPEPSVAIVLARPRTIDERSSGAPGAFDEQTISALNLVPRAAGEPRLGVEQALTLARVALEDPNVEMREALERASFRLRLRTQELQNEVTSRQNERAAHALASLLTTLVGAIAALRRAWAMPLPVYLISFFPALGAIIVIEAGQSLTDDAGWPALILLWGGLALLGGFALYEYRKLIQH